MRRGIPLGHVGLCKDQAWTNFFGGSTVVKLPLTPPPKRVKGDPTVAVDYKTISLVYRIVSNRTCAGALDHMGILFSSVKSPNKSSADAMNRPSTFTVAVLIFVFTVAGSGVLETGVGTRGLCLLATGAEAGGAGVPTRESSGVAMTVKSFPCVSNNACANALNLASNNAGIRDLASL